MITRFPHWIKKRLVDTAEAAEVRRLIDSLHLNTVCNSACCPNRNECFSKKRATFMILGDTCTRDCKFCAVKTGSPAAIDTDEPERLAEAIKSMGMDHIVITSVTRDDLHDGGADHFHKTAHCIKEMHPEATLEMLTPDFSGIDESIDKVLSGPVDILSHNLETVPRLYSAVRPLADYKRSLKLLLKAKEKGLTTKSGIMVGLGEITDEVYGVMRALRGVGCDMLTIGQYLKPTKRQLDVYEFVHPEIFRNYKERAYSLGFTNVLSEPFARTSYMDNQKINCF